MRMNTKRTLRGIGWLFVLAAAGATGTPAPAQSVEQFYKSNQMTFLVGHGAGSGYDQYTRTLVRHMMKYVPGQPAAVVKTVPGASGMRMTNVLYASGPRDGSTFGIADRGLVLQPLLGNQAAQYHPAKMSALGSIGRQTPVCSLWHSAKSKTIQDALAQETILGAMGPSATTTYPSLLNYVLKTRFKIVAGYKASTDILHAMEQGEVEGVCLSWDTVKILRPDWLADGRLKVIVQMASERKPEMKSIPNATEFTANESGRKMLDLYFGPNEMGRPYFGPPGIPQDRLQAVRRAFDATMKDPAFLAEAKKLNMDVDPMTGEEMEKLIAEFYATPQDVVARLKVAIDSFRARN